MSLLVVIATCQTLRGNPTTFTNNFGGHLWNQALNWDSGLPDALSTAVIPSGLASQQALYITDSTAGTSASVGSLIIDAPASNYRAVRAATANRDVTMTFGTGSTSGVLTYATTNAGDKIDFGASVTDSFGTLTFHVPKGLAVTANVAEIRLSNTIVSGMGSLNVATVSYNGNGTVDLRGINDNIPSPAAYNTYGGVTTLNSGVTVTVAASSTIGSLGILRGPLGLATCTFNAGTLSIFNLDGSSDPDPIVELHNPINVIANSTIASHFSATLYGAVRTTVTNCQCDSNAH